ncbi:MAG: gamma-glutamyl-gamma-aminobutyrate hydrolase family protein [Nitrososphaerales archaeon]
MLLVIDNLSSYFNDLTNCLKEAGAAHEVRRYDALLDASSLKNYDGIILSGRMKSTARMNVSNMRLVKLAYESDKPMLGICYGAEIIALALNGSLRRMERRMVGEEIVTVRRSNPLTDKKDTLRVFESHGYYIARLPEEFSALADSSSCKHEIIAHNTKQIFGTQFHPEVNVSGDGHGIIDNFVKLTKR